MTVNAADGGAELLVFKLTSISFNSGNQSYDLGGVALADNAFTYNDTTGTLLSIQFSPTGNSGSSGSSGTSGSSGSSGTSGSSGSSGTSGSSGSSGTSGSSGSSGTSGSSGSSGTSGSSGSSGTSGSSGSSGTSGSSGSSGTSGSSGSSGTSGSSGSSGTSGSSGSSGTSGSSGSSGTSGSSGSSGTSGSSGSSGTSGSSGSSGTSGSSGSSGISGSSGSSGTSGNSFNVLNQGIAIVPTVSDPTFLNFTGAGVVASDSGTGANITIAGGSGSPGTPTTSVQYNNGGSFAGSSDMVFQNTSGLLNVEQLNVGLALGTTATTDGLIKAENDVIAYATSDRRLKTNILNIPNALEKVSMLNGITFEWLEFDANKTRAIHANEGVDVGVIAQEVEAVFPELVSTRANGYKAVKYDKLVAVLIEAVKELNEKVKILEDKLNNK